MNKQSKAGTGIKRRDFIIRTAGAVTLPMLFNGVPLRAFDGPHLEQLFNTEEETDRVLVLLQFSGGNDGINTVIPLDQYSTYTSLRPGVAIPEAKALKLTNASALHPAMTDLITLNSERKLGVVQGVAYPNPNLSHFRSSDIWMSGSASNITLSSGWLGRYLGGQYPGYPDGYPNTSMPDPIAIQMTAVVGLTLIGNTGQTMGMALQDPETFYKLVNGTDQPSGDLPSGPYASYNVEFVREVQIKSLEYSVVIKAAADKATNKATYPSNNRLADQLKIVARLVAGGLKTRVYVVQHNGYDTHAAQVDGEDPTQGAHAVLLQQASQALYAFQRDLEMLKVDERVVTMSFSEFGRRPESNLSLGTDHGTAAPMFFVGTPVQDGITGTNPSLTDLDNSNLKMQFDFRQIYASVLQQWFGADPQTIKTILQGDFQTVQVIKAGGTSNVSEDAASSRMLLKPIAPNPVRGEASVQYELFAESQVRLEVFDNLGFHVATLVSEQQPAGAYQIPFGSNTLPSGTYLVQLSVGRERIAQPMLVVR
jgi:uncharacterized protein (DUF1501 family)